MRHAVADDRDGRSCNHDHVSQTKNERTKDKEKPQTKWSVRETCEQEIGLTSAKKWSGSLAPRKSNN